MILAREGSSQLLLVGHDGPEDHLLGFLDGALQPSASRVFVASAVEGVVNIPQKIKKLKLSISLREDTEKDQVIRVSLRSGNGFHCRKMAEEFFHGGGHEDAAVPP